MAYTVEIRKSIYKLSNGLDFMMGVKITNSSGKFTVRDATLKMGVDDGTNVIWSIVVVISQDQKEMKGYFPNDAFAGFPDDVNVRFRYGSDAPEIIPGIKRSLVTSPDGPGFSGITLPSPTKADFGVATETL